MLQSKLFTKTRKDAPSDETSKNAKLLIRAGYINKEMAGVYSYLPLGFKVLKNIEKIIREEMNSLEGQELLMPAMHPKENWQKTGRWDSMDDLYKVSDSSGREVALGPTHEEIIVPLSKQFISSYKDLPFAAYQFQTKFRMEMRPKSGILRGREFLMKDLYSFHADEKDLDKYYEKAKKAYMNIFDRCGIGEKTFVTFASGGSFSKYSHEFQTVTESGEDTIYADEDKKIAVNKEVLTDEVLKDLGLSKKDLVAKKSIEVGNIFKLMTKYSDPFSLTYKDSSGKEKAVVMGCYGIGLGRLMGAVVEVLSDEKGIVWPKEIAPFAAHLIHVGEQSGESIKKARDIYGQFEKKGIEVLFDDRDLRAGEKFAEADLMGIPLRIVVSEKTLSEGKVEVKNRSSDKAELLTEGDMFFHVEKDKK